MSIINTRLPLLTKVLLAGFLLCGITCYLARGALTDWIMRLALIEAGAEDIRLNVSEVALRRIVVDDLGFTLNRQPVMAGRLTVTRENWWEPSLGSVSVTAVRVPINMATLSKQTPALPTDVNAQPQPSLASKPVRIPAETVSIEGRLVVQAPGIEQALSVKLDAVQGTDQHWIAHASADGPGVKLRAEADYKQDSGALSGRVSLAHLDLAQWSDFIQRVAPSGTPNDWILAGKIDATLDGSINAGEQPAARAVLTLREGGCSSIAQKISVHGVEADMRLDDVRLLRTAPGQRFRVATASFGNLSAHSLEAEFQLQGPERILAWRPLVGELQLSRSL